MFSSVIIGVDHVCLYGLIALYGPTLPRLRLLMAQWVVGLSTLPATWAVWGRVSDDLQYAFAFYFALLRVLYYATLSVLAREVRRGDVVPKGLASWPRTLAFLRRRADDIVDALARELREERVVERIMDRYRSGRVPTWGPLRVSVLIDLAR